MVSGDGKIRSGGGNFKALIHKRPCLASLALNDAVRDRCQGSRRFSYKKLPQLQNLKLSVLKLDGSEFGDFFFKIRHCLQNKALHIKIRHCTQIP